MNLPAPAHTQACEDRDFSEWHQGCPWCAVWVVRVDAAPVQAMLQTMRARMAAYVLPRYERQAHVTVAYRGLMASDPAHTHAPFGMADLQRDIDRLKTAQPQPFALQLQGVGSFTTVPYLAVAEAPDLHALHRGMTVGAPHAGWSYVPHVTMGHYACEVPMSRVLQCLQDAAPAGVWWQALIGEIWLARYRTHDIAGPLYLEGKFDLRTQRYEAAPGALWPNL